MIFQYNALDYVIETTAEGELIYTIGRQSSASPKIRYNLHDKGGVISHKDLAAKLSAHDIKISDLANPQSCFPILFVFGRSDLTVPFFGAKLYRTDIEEVINADPVLSSQINSFQLTSYEDERINRRLRIRLEMVKNPKLSLPDPDELRSHFFEGLCKVNQDFREVAKMFDQNAIEIELHEFEKGAFAGRDIRIKNRYIDQS
jgi:phenylacetate-CoA ligase